MRRLLVLEQSLLSIFFFISSAIPKCIALDVVMTKGILFIYIMSTARVTSPCFSNMSEGNSLYLPKIVFQFICTWWILIFLVVWKSIFIPRYSSTFPWHVISWLSFPNLLLSLFNMSSTTSLLTFDIFRSSMCHMIVHCFPSMSLFAMHLSYGFSVKPHSCNVSTTSF